MVSFTFDDTPKSAAAVGVPILEAYDARATFYVAGGLVDKWSGHWDGISGDEIVALHRQGHEIACHTFSHTRTTDLDAAALAAEIEDNRRYLSGLIHRSDSRISPIPTAWDRCCARDSSGRPSIHRAALFPGSTPE